MSNTNQNSVIAVSVLRREDLAIAIAIAIQAKVSLLLWGKIGIGKSSLFKQLGKLLEFDYVKVLNASTREASDLLGMPQDTNGETVYSPPAWAKAASKARNALVVVEEGNRVGLSLQHALMGVVLDREVGDFPLGEEVSLVAAMNHPGDSIGASEIDAALSNRFLHLSYAPTLIEWCEGMESNWALPELPKLPSNWRMQIPVAAQVVFKFLRSRANETMYYDTPKSARAASGPWPSPRSWETATIVLAASESVGASPEIRSALIAGCVGPSVEREFSQFVANDDLIQPEDVLKNPGQLTLPSRTDQLHVLAAGIVDAVKRNPTRERYMNAWTAMLAFANGGHKDLAATVIGDLFSIGNAQKYPRPLGLEEFREILEATGHTFTSTGGQVN